LSRVAAERSSSPNWWHSDRETLGSSHQSRIRIDRRSEHVVLTRAFRISAVAGRGSWCRDALPRLARSERRAGVDSLGALVTGEFRTEVRRTGRGGRIRAFDPLIRCNAIVKVDGQARILPGRRNATALLQSLKHLSQTGVRRKCWEESGAQVVKSQAHKRPFHAQNECA
jgi:hypothetical protein